MSTPRGTLVLSQANSYWFGLRRAPTNVWFPPGVAAIAVGGADATPAHIADAPDEATATAWAIDCARAFARGDAEWAPPPARTTGTDAQIVARALAEFESAERAHAIAHDLCDWMGAETAEKRIEILARVLGDRVTP